MTKKTVYVLLGDVVNSRGIKDRQRFEKRLRIALDKIMRIYGKSFRVPVKNWKGIDEVAAVLNKAGDVYRIMDTMNDALVPEKIRFVLVKGELDVIPKNKDVSQLDGQVFHVAASLMATIKKEKRLFLCDTGNPLADMALDTQINALFLLKTSWTQKQRNIFNMYFKIGSQDSVAKKLKVTQQSVSKTLNAIAAIQVAALEDKVTNWTHATFD